MKSYDRVKKRIAVTCCILTALASLCPVSQMDTLAAEREWANEWSSDGDSKDTQNEFVSDVPMKSAATERVIILDPGHDVAHTGAHANGLKEEELTLKIARYCREELEKYNVTVHMTRETEKCPYPQTTSVICNKQRVLFAKRVGADAYVSIHLNANTNLSAHGAEIYYPNFNYRRDIADIAVGLSRSVLSNLAALGINNRGFLFRNSEDNSRYPDASLADYYGVIKNSKLNGFPGIIIEHAFLTNTGDVQNYLNSEEKLKALGIADAKGIVEYYNLTKKFVEKEYTNKDLTLTVTPDEKRTTCRIKAEGIPDCNQLQLAVWSKANGQDDIKWYPAQRNSDGTWTQDINIIDYRKDGQYYVHAYIVRLDGTMYFIGDTSFEIYSDATAEQVIVSDVDLDSSTVSGGSFKALIKGVKSASGIVNVYLPVWSEEDQSDIVWYPAKLQEDGNYTVLVDLANHHNNRGVFYIHAYAESGNGLMGMIYNSKIFLTEEASTLTITEEPFVKGSFTMDINNIIYLPEQMRVSFAFWSEEGGQDDLVWVDAKRIDDGVWRRTIYLDQKATKGKYIVHAYIIHHDGTQQLLTANTFILTDENVGKDEKGDANLDGELTLEDAQIILEAGLNIVYLEGAAFTNADMDYDNYITIKDAYMALKKVLGIEK